jgi:hypothetical protein
MTKKRLALIAVLPLTVAVVLGVLAMLPPRPGVTKANFDRVEKRMTLSEVWEILGKDSVIVPTGFAFSGNAARWERFQEELRTKTTHSWSGDDGAHAEITFRHDVVENKTMWIGPRETIWQKIRRWLRLS